MSLKRPIEFGTTFDSFTATKIIGEGGAARVFKATDGDGKLCAVKLLKPQNATKEKRKRFKNEIDFCSRINHKNIVLVDDHGRHSEGESETIFYVMPLYSGSFRDVLNQGVLPDKALVHFVQMLDGVEAAHLKGVVHRDLKPENILFDDANDQLVISDFGIAMFQENELFTAVETKDTDRLANFRYAAPEQRHPGKSVDQRADIFALGLILNEMFTEEVVSGIGYTTIASVDQEYGFLDEIVEKMIQQDPRARFSSIGEIKVRISASQKTFVSQQKISELSGEVVPENEIDDPLVSEPPRLVDVDWNEGRLILYLSCSVNDDWVQALRNPEVGGTVGINHGGIEMGLSTLSVFENVVSTRAPDDERTIQDVINLMRDEWLPNANRAYRSRKETEQRQREERIRASLQKQLEMEKARKKILDNVSIG